MSGKYSDEELLDELRSIGRETDGKVTAEEMRKAEEKPSPETYRKRFGSWNKAKREAGLSSDATSASNEELLAQLRAFAERLERSPILDDVAESDEMPAPETFRRRFGSWNEAKREAGLEVVARHGGWYSERELLSALAGLIQGRDETVSSTVMDDLEGYPSAQTFIDRFGSWEDAKRRAREYIDSSRTLPDGIEVSVSTG